MKVSEITTTFLRNYLRLDDNTFDTEITAYLTAARKYVRSYTNLSDMAIDTHEDITDAVLVLVSDMFENHLYSQNGTVSVKTNKIVDSILSLHSVDLV